MPVTLPVIIIIRNKSYLLISESPLTIPLLNVLYMYPQSPKRISHFGLSMIILVNSVLLNSYSPFGSAHGPSK